MATPNPQKPLSDLLRAPNEPLAFSPVQEPWTIYRLEDGTMIRVRVMLVKVAPRLQDGRPTYGPGGEPLIDMNFTQVLDVDWPEHIQAEIEARRAASDED